MFENLTACFIVNAYFFAQAVTFFVVVCVSRAWSLLVGFWDSFDIDCLIFFGWFLSVFGFSCGNVFCFSLESLILAQDERWRRA